MGNTDTKISIKENTQHVTCEEIEQKWYDSEPGYVQIRDLPEYLIVAAGEAVKSDYQQWGEHFGMAAPEILDRMENATELDRFLIEYICQEAFRLVRNSTDENCEKIVNGDLSHLVENGYMLMLDEDEWEAAKDGAFMPIYWG